MHVLHARMQDSSRGSAGATAHALHTRLQVHGDALQTSSHASAALCVGDEVALVERHDVGPLAVGGVVHAQLLSDHPVVLARVICARPGKSWRAWAGP